MMGDDVTLEALVARSARPLTGDDQLRGVLDLIGDARVVLLGESTHGTSEFYRARARLTRLLIEEKAFDAIAVEADWPDALRVSRYLRCQEDCADMQTIDALAGFRRFPLWMWRNREILALVEWLREHDGAIADRYRRVGFFGLDLYSLRASMDAVIRYLETVNEEAACEARRRYACFDHLADDPQRYGRAASFGMRRDCEQEVLKQLLAMQGDLARQLQSASGEQDDELFYAQQNARVAANAEAYYRAMYQGRNASWNQRDTHMADTLCALLSHLSARGRPAAKIVVWAHNSHIGDARATELGEDGEVNLGQLMRERLGNRAVFLLGFSTFSGTVTAASDWDNPPQRKTVRESLPDSVEHLLHRAGTCIGAERFLLPLTANPGLQQALTGADLLERAIGVIYRPETERLSHYFHADIGRQFDALIHVDTTSALHPLDAGEHWQHEYVPDTWPSGM